MAGGAAGPSIARARRNNQHAQHDPQDDHDAGDEQHLFPGYRALREGEREAVISFLNSLILYSTTDLPTDVDGDGRIAAHFRVAGQDTGEERFNPEWLFNTPGQIEVFVWSASGEILLSSLASTFPTVIAYVIDTPRTTSTSTSAPPMSAAGGPSHKRAVCQVNRGFSSTKSP